MTRLTHWFRAIAVPALAIAHHSPPERDGVPHRAGNESDEPALLTVTFVLPVDVPTTIGVE